MTFLLVVMFVITLIVFRNILHTFINIFLTCVLVVDVLAFMYFTNIDLNAISLLYLVWAIGLSLECCGHLTLDYLESEGSNKERTGNF